MTPLEQLVTLFKDRQLVDVKLYLGSTDKVALVDIAQELSQMLKAADEVEPLLKFDEGTEES